MPMPPFGDPGAPPPVGVPPMSAPAPNFGAPQPPSATMPAPAAAPPRPPMFTGQPPAMQQPGPDFAHAALPMIASAIMGRGNPALIGAGLAGYLKGRELKRQETESYEDRIRRRQLEQAKFYGDLAQTVQGYDDEAQLRADLEPFRKVAEFQGVNIDLFHVSDAKKQNKARKDASGVLDQLRKVHGPSVDDPAWQQAHSTTVNGVSMKVSEIAKLAQAPIVMDQSGKAIAPTGAPFKADNPNEMKIAAYARDHGKRPEQLSAPEIQEALGEGKAPTANVGSFEDFVVRKFGKNPTPAQITAARKEYNQSDDRPPSTGSGEYREFLMTDKLAKEWQTATQPVREMRRQFGLMQTGLQRFRSGDKNGGAQAVLVTFQKILDPTSVVRESEYARTAAGQAFMDRIQGYTERLAQGGAGLTDADMAAMVESAKQMLANAETFTQGTRQRLARTAGRYKVPEELVFDDVGLPSSAAPDAGGGGDANSALAELERRRKARGVK